MVDVMSVTSRPLPLTLAGMVVWSALTTNEPTEIPSVNVNVRSLP